MRLERACFPPYLTAVYTEYSYPSRQLALGPGAIDRTQFADWLIRKIRPCAFINRQSLGRFENFKKNLVERAQDIREKLNLASLD
jgi:hypothetical protein